MLARCAVMQQLRSIQQLILTHKREILLFASIVEIFVCLHAGRDGFRTRRAGGRRRRQCSDSSGSRKRALRRGWSWRRRGEFGGMRSSRGRRREKHGDHALHVRRNVEQLTRDRLYKRRFSRPVRIQQRKMLAFLQSKRVDRQKRCARTLHEHSAQFEERRCSGIHDPPHRI